LFISSLRNIQKGFIDEKSIFHYTKNTRQTNHFLAAGLAGLFFFPQVKVMQTELKVRQILGRTYLNENRLEEALDVFTRILADYPEDLETLLILGNFYLASGDGKTAQALYMRARQLNPANKTIERQLALAEEMGDSGLPETSPTDLPAVARLLQRLTGQNKSVSETDILRAATLLDRIINSENPAALVSEHLDEIDELLPALIELNIRQAYADGRHDLVEVLRVLQLNIDYQLDARSENVAGSDVPAVYEGRICLLLPDLENKSARMTTLKTALEALGCQVTERSEYLPARDQKPDVVITSNPHINPALCESLEALAAAQIPILLDLDTDFEKQPISHHAYLTQGLGTQLRSNAYTTALALADLVTVPSETLAVGLGDVTRRICLLPDGWASQNKLWEKPAPSRSTLNIGWVGTNGELEDLVIVRRYILRILREFPHTRIVVLGNPQAYRLFESLPENRRLYLPVVAHEEFPYLLSQLDILLVPLRNLPYNLSLPDTALVEAGARGIPWLASPTPAFRRWKAGGILCESPDDWHLNLRHLVMDDDLRQTLGTAGKNAARAREMSQLGPLWLERIRQVSAEKSALRRSPENQPAISTDLGVSR
jgi:tetratricopeptide (TPR) repeat protein